MKRNHFSLYTYTYTCTVSPYSRESKDEEDLVYYAYRRSKIKTKINSFVEAHDITMLRTHILQRRFLFHGVIIF